MSFASLTWREKVRRRGGLKSAGDNGAPLPSVDFSTRREFYNARFDQPFTDPDIQSRVKGVPPTRGRRGG